MASPGRIDAVADSPTRWPSSIPKRRVGTLIPWRARSASLAAVLDGAAFAQPKAPSADEARVADEHFKRGKARVKEGKYQEALAEYSAAWALKQTFDIAANLGNVELEAMNNHPPRFPADIVNSARLNLVVRDGFASFFYHPYLGTSYLQEIVPQIKALGTSTFVSPAGL